jgi:uncharacterized NAD(P)/FAD-binding protein YdhS
LLNVPAKNMSALADDDEHFLRWARANYDSAAGPSDFLPRRLYGRYIESILARAAKSDLQQRLQWKKDEVCALSPQPDGSIEIELRSGNPVRADRVVLAVGTFPASELWLPGYDVKNSGRYFRNPWSGEAFEGVRGLRRILLVGSGLTSLDVAVELRLRGFRGTLHLLSRHGLLSRPHKAVGSWPPFWNERSPKNVLGLLRLIREQVEEAQRQDIDWRPVIDSLRPYNSLIWQSLPKREQQSFLRHVRSYWDVHRHRAVPEIAEFVAEQIGAGQIEVHAGRITHYQEKRAVRIIYRKRENSKEECVSVDRVINCTGPETDCRRLEDPLLASLLLKGMVRPDPLCLGLDVSRDGALLDRDGAISQRLYAVGPIRKGNLWESTAVPEIRKQVHRLVEHLLNASGKAQSAHPLPLGAPSAEAFIVSNA